MESDHPEESGSPKAPVARPERLVISHASDAPPVVHTATNSVPERTSHDVPGYQLIRLEGEGGMGTVWKARQISTQRIVALKLMRTDIIGSTKNQARFEREVELAARLEHPNIARVYDSGLAHGFYYYAMEFVGGIHLDRFVREGHLDRNQILHLFTKVCNAVHHAHQRGVLHRDLKPTNILVTPDGEPHVVDFGLAIPTDASCRSVVSVAGDFVGTLPYMPPEQVQGKIDDIDVRADVYALGVILYELLVGAMPHDNSGSRIDLANQIICGRIRRPSGLAKQVDGELETIILKAMMFEVDQRYDSARLLGDDIQSYLGGAPISVKPLTFIYFLRKWVGRHLVPVFIGTATAILMVAVMISAFISIADARDKAERGAKASEHALYLTRIGYAKTEIERNNHPKARDILDSSPVEHRGWEWKYLRNQADASLWTVSVTFGDILNVTPVFGNTLLAVSNRRQVILIHASDGRIYKNVLLESDDMPLKMADSLENGTVVGVTYDNTLCAWSGESGKRLWSHQLEKLNPTGLAVSTPSGLIAVYSSNGDIVLVEAHSGVRASTLQASGQIHDLAFSPDGQNFVCAGAAITVCDVATGSMTRVLESDNEVLSHAEFNSDGTLLIAIGESTACIWDTVTWHHETKKVDGLEAITQVGIASDNESLYAIGGGLGIRIVSRHEPSKSRVIHGHTSTPIRIRSVPYSSRLVSHARQEIKCWDPNKHGVRVLTTDISMPVNALVFGPHADRLAAASQNMVYVINLKTGSQRSLHKHADSVTSIGFNSTGQKIITSGKDKRIIVWDCDTGNVVSERRIDRGIPEWASFSPNDQMVYVGTNQGVFGMSSILTGEQIQVIGGSQLRSSVYSKSTNRVIAAFSTGDVEHEYKLVIWDIELHHAILQTTIKERPSCLVTSDWSTDQIAWTTSGNDLTVFDAKRSMVALRFPTSTTGSYAISALSPEGHRLVTGGPSIQVWDMASCTPLLQLRYPGIVDFNSIAFGRDGTTLAAAGRNKIVLWTP